MLILNAGVSSRESFKDMKIETSDYVMNVNYHSNVALTKVFYDIKNKRLFYQF